MKLMVYAETWTGECSLVREVKQAFLDENNALCKDLNWGWRQLAECFIKWNQQGQKLSDERRQAFLNLTSSSKTRVLNKVILLLLFQPNSLWVVYLNTFEDIFSDHVWEHEFEFLLHHILALNFLCYKIGIKIYVLPTFWSYCVDQNNIADISPWKCKMLLLSSCTISTW